jgi:long-chain acyl-CoA synthetase
VYGVADPRKGESVRAAIVLREGASDTGDEIMLYCRERMASYKVPASVQFLGELPKNATGKILKRLLRERAAGALRGDQPGKA